MASNYKKYLAATIATTVAASAAVTVIPNSTKAADTLKDLDKNAYFYEAVVALNNQGVIKGYEDGTFRHSLNVTRGQVAAMIARALKIDQKQVADPGFKDVKKGDRFYNEIAAIFDAGIVDGVTAEKFEPNRDITRAEMSKIIAIAFKLKVDNGYSNKFTDVPKNSWYAEYVEALFDTGVTLGKTKTSYAPAEKVNRGQMAAFIYRALQIKPAPPVGGGGGGGGGTPVDKTPPELEKVTLTIDGKKFSAINKKGVWKATVTDAQLAELAAVENPMFTAIEWKASEAATGIISIDGSSKYEVVFKKGGKAESPSYVKDILGEQRDPQQDGVSIGKFIKFLNEDGQNLNSAKITFDDLTFSVSKVDAGWEISLAGLDVKNDTINFNLATDEVSLVLNKTDEEIEYTGTIRKLSEKLSNNPGLDSIDFSLIEGTVGSLKELLGDDNKMELKATLTDASPRKNTSTVTINVTNEVQQ